MRQTLLRLFVPSLLLCLSPGLAASGSEWEPLMEPGSGGWLTGLQVSPWDSRRVLTGGDMLGIGFSSDRGDSWRNGLGLKAYEIGDFSWHPSKPDVVWAGTMSGPYVSFDGGQAWQERREGMPSYASGFYSAPVEKILFDPNDESHLLAFGGSSRRWSSRKGALWGVVWESRDSGLSWSALSTLNASGFSLGRSDNGVNIVSACLSFGSSPLLYVALDNAGIFVSEDFGRSWSPRTSGLSSKAVERVASHPSEPLTAWACVNRWKDGELWRPGGIFKTVDGGRSWTSISSGLNQASDKKEHHASGYKGFAVSPKNPDVMWTSDISWSTGVIFKSEDGGKSWRKAASHSNVGYEQSPSSDACFVVKTAYPAGLGMTTIAADPGDELAVYASGGEYIVRSFDGGKTWEDATAKRLPDGSWTGRGYSGLCSANYRFDPYRKGHAVLLAMDAGKCWETFNGAKSFFFRGSTPFTAWGGGDDACFSKNGAVFATTGQNGSEGGVLRTLDGVFWTFLSGKERGLPGFHDKSQGFGVYCLPDDPKMVWSILGGELYRSVDGGELWRRLPAGDGKWIAGDPLKPSRFYVSGKKDVLLTEDGEAFSSIGGPHSPGRILCDVKGRLWMASGSESKRPGLWLYSNGAWTRLLDEKGVFSVSVDPSNPERVAVCFSDNPFHDVCSAKGVWLSVDGGRSWGAFNEGLPMLRGCAIAFDPFEPGRLVFGSNGGGFFAALVPDGWTPKLPYSYSSSSDDAAFAKPSGD